MATTPRIGWRQRFLALLGAWLLLVAPLSAVVSSPEAAAKTPPRHADAGAARQSNDAKPNRTDTKTKTKSKTKSNQGEQRGGGPQTTIGDKPQRSTDSAVATFTYRSSAANASFACSLDGADFQACPADGQTYNDLAPGKHRFEVRAVDATGAVDKTPGGYAWTIRDAKTGSKSDRGSGKARSGKKDRSAGSRKSADGAPAATAATGTTVTLPFTDDFEQGDLSDWSETGGIAIQGQQVAAGAGAARARSAGDPAFATATFATPETDVYARLKYKALSQDAQSVTLLALQKPNGDPLASLNIDRDGRLGLRRAGGKAVHDRAAAAQDAWHEIELHVETDANGQIEVWQDGAPVDRLTLPFSAASAKIGQATIGERAKDRSFDIAFDDVAIATRFIEPDTTAASGGAPPQTKPDEPATQRQDRAAGAPRQDGAAKNKAKGASERGVALRVASVDPANGAKNVAPDVVVSAVFADAIDPATLTDASFTLAKKGGDPVAAAVAYDPATRRATLTPAAPLASGAYLATIRRGEGGVRAATGASLAKTKRWTFAVAAPAPPPDTRLLDTRLLDTPANPATSADATFDVAATTADATFECALDGAAFGPCPTASAAKKQAKGAGGQRGRSSDGQASRSAGAPRDGAGPNHGARGANGRAGRQNAVAIVYAGLADGPHSFAVRAKDAAGAVDPTPASYDWIVQASAPGGGDTGGSGVTSQQAIADREPVATSKNVATTANIEVTFAEPMDPATLTTATFTLQRAGGKRVAADVVYDSPSQTATLRPTHAMAANATFTAKLKGGAAGVATADGASWSSDASWSFTTVNDKTNAKAKPGKSGRSAKARSVETKADSPLTFAPDADARVESANPTTNYGSDDNLKVDTLPQMESLLRFVVAGVGAGTVTQATLRLHTTSYTYSDTPNGPAVFMAGNNWTENGVTWNTKPAATGTAIANVGAIASNVWVEYDVTAAVAGDGSYTFDLVPEHQDAAYFYAKEETANPEFRPQLVLTVAGGSPTATPPPTDTPTATPTGTPTTTPTPTATPTATPSDVVFAADADARVDSSRADRNYGTDPSNIALQADSSPQIETFVRFNVDGVSGVSKAMLRVHTTTYTGAATSNGPAVYLADNGWAETDVTWNTKPPRLSQIPADDLGNIDGDAWAEYDVTPLVTGNGVYTFDLASTSSDGVFFWSREASDPSVRPQLVLTVGDFTPPTPTPTPSVTPTVTPTSTPTASASPAGGFYSSSQVVTLSASEPSTIYYTGDGTDPRTSSSRAVFNSPFTVDRTTQIRFVAITSDDRQSPVESEVYTITTAFGFRDMSYSGSSAPTAKDAESKLWYNDGSWWGVFYNPSTPKGWRVYRLDMATQLWSNVAADGSYYSPILGTTTATTLKFDALSDGAQLYLASHKQQPAQGNQENHNGSSSDPGEADIQRLSYNPSTTTYSLDLTKPIAPGTMETLVIGKDTTDMLWAAFTQDNVVKIAHSQGADDDWTAPYQMPTVGSAISSDDTAALVTFGTKVGVMWSNQCPDHLDCPPGADERKMYFAWHADGAADTDWTTEVAYGVPGQDSADDHINLKADSSGRVYAAVKTSLDQGGDTLIHLLVRQPDGTWSSHVFDTVADNHTRAIVLVDDQDGFVYVFAAAPCCAGGTIYYKRSSLNNISFPPGLGTPIIQSSSDTLNNVTSTKQTVNGGAGILVVAGADNSKMYLHNVLNPP